MTHHPESSDEGVDPKVPQQENSLSVNIVHHTSHVLQLCLALQDRLEKVEKEVQSLKGENLALKLVLEKKTFASVVKDGEVEVDSWKVVAASATKCTLKRHSAVDLNNRFSTLSDECEEGAINTTSATPSVSVERGSSAEKKATTVVDVPMGVSVVVNEGDDERETEGNSPSSPPKSPVQVVVEVTHARYNT
ncbi:hypothetical protein Hamer_G018328 [Homarus americanus]|uniref:Uncharacterized protein n=1 Tax=Homarus americanus TaxID=6706 RepID=A0A8J5JV94_HOMAM|nr:hypothetical protein Hamer_G018328 [Homarus americanus]